MSDVRTAVRAEPDSETYRTVRRTWIAHSIAEDNRDLPGLIATLVPDCVYEMPQIGRQWEGHEGARRFYTELLTAFPDVTFDLTHIVIGPQGVWEEARVEATHEADWQGLAASGERVEFEVLIYFPWVPEAEKFAGERVWVFGLSQGFEGRSAEDVS